jgi:hypothetical protein
MHELKTGKHIRFYSQLELALIFLLAIIPLFTSFPYRVNIFLSWEGAYRLSQGQVPYRDFGMPLGYMYWVIPAMFFKIFGTQMITLIKAQVLINIISGLAFRSILKSLDVQPGVRLLSVILYCISFSFFNFWPWYNHTVIVYEMTGLAFLLHYIAKTGKQWIFLSISALFTFFSFFTKQDGGGLALILCLILLAFDCFRNKKWKPLLIFSLSYLAIALVIILPLTQYNFGYWFNHGQPPHTSRISLFEIADEFFMNSQWIKFYLFIILLLILVNYKTIKEFLVNKSGTLFLIVTVGILVEAAILQVTSYTPPDNNIFFHSFAIAFILSQLSRHLKLDFNKPRILTVGCLGLALWWSGIFWKYFQRIAQRVIPGASITHNSKENIVNRNTYIIHPPANDIPESEWTFTGLNSFQKIYMPKATAQGIQRLLNMDRVKIQKSSLKVLNMSELTPLAVEMGYQLEKGPEIPLWYHLGVAMFNKQAVQYENKIRTNQYDLVIFEYVPSLNNFYPFRVRDTLISNYQKIDSFPAPRRGDTQGTIEVYIPKTSF